MGSLFRKFVTHAALFTALFSLTGCADNVTPGCDLILPLENSSFFGGEDMYVKAVAWDDDGSVDGVELFLDGISILTLPSAPYEIIYSPGLLETGSHVVRAVVTDDQGATASTERIIRVLPEPEVFTDPRDGHDYRYVEIGNQTWMIDNLAYLPEVHREAEESADSPVYYVYGYDGNDVEAAKQTANYAKYGVLYNWEAAKTAAPEGWHLSSEEEWGTLSLNPENDFEDIYWGRFMLHTSEGGNNHYGLSLTTGGARSGGTKVFNSLGETGEFWTSTYSQQDATQINAYFFSLKYGLWGVDTGTGGPNSGLSIRCLKD
jgi:uncharacterized protein (TIGR02145 family)